MPSCPYRPGDQTIYSFGVVRLLDKFPAVWAASEPPASDQAPLQLEVTDCDLQFEESSIAVDDETDASLFR
jgi:hypothetical protein